MASKRTTEERENFHKLQRKTKTEKYELMGVRESSNALMRKNLSNCSEVGKA